MATYGQVAAVAGLGGHARQVGYALHALADDTVPWQRVVNARGEISLRSEPGREGLQQAMLEAEGVVFRDGRTDLARYRWEPDDRVPSPAARRGRPRRGRPRARSL